MLKYTQHYKKEFLKMAKKKTLTASYDSLSLLIRVVLQVIFGVIVGGIYRIVRYTESKNIITLVVGLICTFTGIGNLVAWIVDLVTLIMNGKYTIFVD